MSTSDLEGWCTDPFARHYARWMSNGVPTKLVRDEDGTESYDDPPDEEWKVTPTPIVADVPLDASARDEMRERMTEAGTFGATWGSHFPMPGERDQ